jgi:excisionase family DNA binding protein
VAVPAEQPGQPLTRLDKIDAAGVSRVINRPLHVATMKTLLTVKQAAAQLGLSTSLVYALCGSKRLRHERHGLGRGKILIPEDAIEEYRRSVTVAMAQGADQPPPAPKKPRVKLKHLELS